MAKRTKYSIEYPVNCSPEMLYNYLSTPAGLSEWFADDVQVLGDQYTFIWEGSQEEAKLVEKKANKHVSFKWLGRKNESVSFDIQRDELTGDVALIISDYEEESAHDEAKMIYDSSISRLHSVIGG